MRIGTAHFRNLKAAVRYYSDYGYSETDVREKVDKGEIFLGKPEVRIGEALCVADNGTRYYIRPASYYTVDQEYTGRAQISYVARFSGEFLGAADSAGEAERLIWDHIKKRNEK